MSGYIGAQPVPQATQHREAFTATASQTSFPTVGYTPQFVDVYLNGVKLAAADYTATNGSDIVLAVGAAASDILEYVAYTPFEVASQTFTGTTTVDALVATGNIAATGAVTAGDLFITGPTPIITLTDNDVANEYTKIQNAAGDTYIDTRNGATNGQLIIRGSGGGVTDEYARFDASGNFGIGTTSPDEALHVVGKILSTDEVRAEVVAYGSNQNEPYMVAASTSYTGATTNWGTYGFQHRLKANSSGSSRITVDSRLGEAYSLTEAGDAVFAGAVTAGDMNITGPSPILTITDNDTANEYTQIQNVSGVTYVDLRNGASNGFLIFRGLGGNVVDEYARFTPSGALLHGTTTAGSAGAGDIVANGGIYLGGAVAANYLDDYEEGTWTPTVTATTTNPTFTYTNRNGVYTKIGNRVQFTCHLRLDITNAGAGTATITGLPFAPVTYLDGISFGLTSALTTTANINAFVSSSTVVVGSTYVVGTGRYLTFTGSYTTTA